MRLIGYVENEPRAQLFSDYLYSEGIPTRVEPEREGQWAIWAYEEDTIERAMQLLDDFRKNPQAARYAEAAEKGRHLRDQHKAEEEAAASRQFNASEVFRATRPRTGGTLTIALIAISVLVAALTRLGSGELTGWLFLDVDAVRAGQIWRLLTPIFIHLGPLHLLFNMLWLYDLGNMLEAHQGPRFLLVFVLVIGIVPNLAQALVVGPGFGGMSGVVYGLLGYVWLRGKFDPASGLFLHPQTVALMIIWFFLGLTGFMSMANVVHGVGLGMGMIWGYLAAHFSNSLRR